MGGRDAGGQGRGSGRARCAGIFGATRMEVQAASRETRVLTTLDGDSGSGSTEVVVEPGVGGS